MPQFVLKLQDIDSVGRQYSWPVRTEWLASELKGTDLSVDAARGEGRLDVTAQRSGADVLVTGRVSAGIVAECVRCLEDAKIAVDAELASLFTARGVGHRPPSDEEDLSPEELMREFFSGEEIVLDEVIREQIILDVPMQPLCREDCPGIEVPAHVRPPADFGAEAGEDLDPRMAPLKNLVARGQDEE